MEMMEKFHVGSLVILSRNLVRSVRKPVGELKSFKFDWRKYDLIRTTWWNFLLIQVKFLNSVTTFHWIRLLVDRWVWYWLISRINHQKKSETVCKKHNYREYTRSAHKSQAAQCFNLVVHDFRVIIIVVVYMICINHSRNVSHKPWNKMFWDHELSKWPSYSTLPQKTKQFKPPHSLAIGSFCQSFRKISFRIFLLYLCSMDTKTYP